MNKTLKDNDFLTELGVELIKQIIEDDFINMRHYDTRKVILTDRAKEEYELYQTELGYPEIPSELVLNDGWGGLYAHQINEVFELIDFGYVEEKEV
jgi:hypothetical protein